MCAYLILILLLRIIISPPTGVLFAGVFLVFVKIVIC